MSLFSINTNLSALAALQSLTATQQAENSAQSQVSSGKRVAGAADNPAIYAIAATINANVSGLSAVSDSLNFGAQVIATASNAVSNISTTLDSLQQTVTASGQTGLNLTTLQSQVTAALTSINQYAQQATFSGVNLLTTTTDSGAQYGTLNVVQGLDGALYQVANQATTLNAGATNLTSALGLAGLSVTGGTTGVKLALDNNLTVASFAPGSGADASLQLTAGTKTFAFEFTDDSLGTAIPLQTAQNANTQIVAVHINSTTNSTDQVVGALVNSLQNNGFGVTQGTDGSISITGQGVTAASFGSVTAGAFTASTTSGITSTALTGTAAVISAVQSAVSSLNTVAANLGAATQQITGIQNFTTSLSSALTAGVGALTDANLAAESASLSSLQTKQQLATQALSIANQQPQSLLSLFKNL